MLERQKQKEKEQSNFNVEQRISEWITHYSEVNFALILVPYKFL